MSEWLPLDRVAVDARTGRWVGPDWDHPAFRTRVLAWQAAFAGAGGRDWALYFEDATAFAAALFGAWHAGKRVFLCADNLPATRERLAGQVDGFAGDFADGGVMPADVVPDTVLAPLDEAATRLLVFTSGSTGEPVAIEKRLDQLAREVEALEAAFGADLGAATVHGTVSHQHIYGLLFRVLWPLAAGRPIAPRTFFHEDLLAALAGQPALLVASPAHLKRLPQQLDWASLGGQLRAVFSSGGALPAEAALEARRWLGVAPHRNLRQQRDRRHRVAALGRRTTGMARAARGGLAGPGRTPAGALAAPGPGAGVVDQRGPGTRRRRRVPPARARGPHRQDRGAPGVAGWTGA